MKCQPVGSVMDDVYIERLQDALRKAAAQFRFYQEQHLVKGTQEGYGKAHVNSEFAKMCEDAVDDN